MQIWNTEAERLKSNAKPSPYVLELTCALERAVAFAFGGNPKVLAKGVMDPLWLSQGIIENGMPTLRKISDSTSNLTMTSPITIRARMWPMVRDGKYPAIASKFSQTLHYGLMHYLVSEAVSPQSDNRLSAACLECCIAAIRQPSICGLSG